MASAVALRRQLAGRVPAIRTAAMSIGLAGSVLSLPAVAQSEPTSQDQLRSLHHTLVVAETNLGAALRDKEVSRAKSASEPLFNLLKAQKLPASSCLGALESLGGVAVAVTYAVHPVTTGDLGSMNADGLRFSAQMRPAPETLEKWYADSSVAYRTKMAACEREAGVGPSPRSLPTQFTQK